MLSLHQDVNALSREGAYEIRFPIVLLARREGGIENRLKRRVFHRLNGIENRRAERSERLMACSPSRKSPQ